MRASFLASDRTYGARRMWHDILAEGISYGLHRIGRLMRLQALQSTPAPASSLTLDLGERQTSAVATNVLNRAFEAPSANRKWIADFTYIWTAEGWLYVAAVRSVLAPGGGLVNAGYDDGTDGHRCVDNAAMESFFSL